MNLSNMQVPIEFTAHSKPLACLQMRVNVPLVHDTHSIMVTGEWNSKAMKLEFEMHLR
jgi:hypothetical protein